ncbi:hypothetical protein C8R44DRAFT_879956 [Mycena epipterygia]|nr:hypothetical protein C8R44DRAFT_879956 [Mycena epipterygia]
MKSLVKLLPRLRRRAQSRSVPSAVVQRSVTQQPHSIILDGVLDISKETSDAIAAEEQQECQPFEVNFPPGSPTYSGRSFSPGGKRQKASSRRTHTSPSASTPSAPPTPLSAVAPLAAVAPLPDVLASELSRRRNFKGRPLGLVLLIPPMPTMAPPTPRTSLSTHSLRHQPRFTDLNTSPVRRCRTFPFSQERAPRSIQDSPCVSSSVCASEASGDSEPEPEYSTTPPGSPTVFVFPSAPRATFTKPIGPVCHSVAREIFPTGETEAAGVEPLCIPVRSTPAMDALFSSMDDIYEELHCDVLSFVTISLSDSESSDSDFDSRGEEGDADQEDADIVEGPWWTTYSLSEEYTTFFPPALLQPAASMRQRWPCMERADHWGRYCPQGSRSMPDLCSSLSQA